MILLCRILSCNVLVMNTIHVKYGLIACIYLRVCTELDPTITIMCLLEFDGVIMMFSLPDLFLKFA
jgi:hypothetical protein